MIVSRILLAIPLLILSGMVYVLHLDLVKLSENTVAIGDKISHIKTEAPIYKREGTVRIDKPRVPPVRFLVKRTRSGVPTRMLYYNCIGVCPFPK
jgi:hypothetical protein